MDHPSDGKKPRPSSSRADTFQQLVEGTTTIAQFMLDPDGTIVEWPAGAEHVYGYEATEATGQPMALLVLEDQAHPTLPTVLETARRGGTTQEGWHRRADGQVFWARCTLSPLTNEEFEGYAVLSQDTTERRQRLVMLERQNNRLKEFTDILSHDLRSPLSVLDGRLHLYRETGESEHLDQMEATIHRMAALVRDLLRVAENSDIVENPEPTDLSPIVETAREGTLGPEATLEYESVPDVVGASDRLVQVFENLFRNSADHGGTSVGVQVGPLQDGFYVEDDGPGIPEGDRERVFDHGFSTRPDGTGFGLSIVKSIVKAHGWDIAVTESEAGGARFEITGTDFVADP